MTQGFEAYDETGFMTIAVTDRLTKVIGTATTTTSNGSIAIDIPTWGTVWIQASTNVAGGFFVAPRTWYSNGRIYWDFDTGLNAPPATFRRAMKIIYGVY